MGAACHRSGARVRKARWALHIVTSLRRECCSQRLIYDTLPGGTMPAKQCHSAATAPRRSLLRPIAGVAYGRRPPPSLGGLDWVAELPPRVGGGDPIRGRKSDSVPYRSLYVEHPWDSL